MKRHIKVLFAVAAATILMDVPKTFAAGTAAGTSVDSSASVSFSVGGSPQSPVTSDPITFVVDKKINVTVVESGVLGYTDVLPGATKQILTFKVFNYSNATQDFLLTVLNQVSTTPDPFGGVGTDNFDTLGAPAPQAFVDSNDNGVFDSGTDPTYLDNIAADASVTVLVQADMPSGVLNGNIAVVTLKAEAREASGSPGGFLEETPGADTPGTVDVVFGDLEGSDDDEGDAVHSARDAYRVQTAVISVIKSSRIISDGVNSSNFKRIPGAVIEYCIEVTNTGSSSATGVVVTDNLDDPTSEPVTYVPGSIVTEPSDCATAGGVVEDDDADDTGEPDLNTANFSAGPPRIMTATFPTLAGGGATSRVRFQVTIN